ncbi:hypothetical protein J0H58_04615 [bacterium]|nr:hypothetical protein [bacterium]
MTRLLVPAVCFAVVTVLTATGRPVQDAKKTDLPAPDFKLTSGEFEVEYKQDRDAAVRKYTGKVVEVTGEVFDVILAVGGKAANIMFYAADRQSSIAGAYRSNDMGVLTELGKGETVTLRGTFNDSGMGFVAALDGCVVVKKGPSTVVRMTSVELSKQFSAAPAEAAKKLKGKTVIVTGVVTALKPKSTAPQYLELKDDGKTPVSVSFGSNFSTAGMYKVGDPITVRSSDLGRRGEQVRLFFSLAVPAGTK